MGEGNVDIDDYVRKYADCAPGGALSLEVIVTQPRIYPLSRSEVLGRLPHDARLGVQPLPELVENGKPRPAEPPVPKEMAAQREREDVEASMRYAHKLLDI